MQKKSTEEKHKYTIFADKKQCSGLSADWITNFKRNAKTRLWQREKWVVSRAEQIAKLVASLSISKWEIRFAAFCRRVHYYLDSQSAQWTLKLHCWGPSRKQFGRERRLSRSTGHGSKHHIQTKSYYEQKQTQKGHTARAIYHSSQH